MNKHVLISDTHCSLNKIDLPDGDILIHAGDLTFRGDIKETSKELRRLKEKGSKFKHIIFTEGNHDWLGQRNPDLMDQMCKDNGIILLRDSGITIDNIRYFGSPWQPEFCNWAFNLPRGEALRAKWALIPDDTQVLITHCPPMGILDGVERFNGKTQEYEIEHVGCQDLTDRIKDLKSLKLHVFGHIHPGFGSTCEEDVKFVNAALLNDQYKVANKPIIIGI